MAIGVSSVKEGAGASENAGGVEQSKGKALLRDK